MSAESCGRIPAMLVAVVLFSAGCQTPPLPCRPKVRHKFLVVGTHVDHLGLDSVNEQIGLRLSMQSAMPRNSDDSSFRIRGIPALRFYTGTHAHDHNTTDRAENINAPGMVVVTKLAEGVLRAIADQHD
jgi:hypothetical protein